jgi:hypothetical protein
VPWIDPELVLDVALGGALAAIRAEIPNPDPDQLDGIEERIDQVGRRGVLFSVGVVQESFAGTLETYTELFGTFKGIKSE